MRFSSTEQSAGSFLPRRSVWREAANDDWQTVGNVPGVPGHTADVLRQLSIPDFMLLAREVGALGAPDQREGGSDTSLSRLRDRLGMTPALRALFESDAAGLMGHDDKPPRVKPGVTAHQIAEISAILDVAIQQRDIDRAVIGDVLKVNSTDGYVAPPSAFGVPSAAE